MVKCLTIDDEPLALDILHNYIKSTPGLELAGSFTKPLEAFAFLQHTSVDLLFIDIGMPEIGGLEFVRSLKNPPQVVLTTAFREYASEAFEIQALDYLVKPISRERFLRAIDKFSSVVRKADSPDNQASSYVFIKVDKAMVKVELRDIFYIESLKNYVRIKTAESDLVSYHTLSYMEDKLPVHLFQRIHKSYIVNLEHIEKYTSEDVQIGRNVLPVGKLYREMLLKRLAQRSI